MAIPIQCPECHKRYQAPDSMAGRRVKCKYCGVVFLIAGDARTDSPDFDLSDLNDLSTLGTAAGTTSVGGAKAAAARPGPGAGPSAGATAGAPGGPDLGDMDALFQREYSDAGAPRTNKLYVFPMSRLLDRWLPPVLLGIGILWVVREGWSRNTTGYPWVGAMRAGVFLLAFFASIYPFTLMGVRTAARKLNYELPPGVNLRVLGTFAVPAALAAALWLIYQDVTGLLLGAAIGVAVALPVLFLMLRLLPAEAPITFAYAAGTFLLSIVVTATALFALNLMLVGILRSAKTEHMLTVSPFGPGFRWDGPYRAANVKYAAKPGGEETDNGNGAEDPSSPTTAPATGPSGTTRPALTIATTRESTAQGPSATENKGPSTPTVPTTGENAHAGPRVAPGNNSATAGGADHNPFLPDVGSGNAGAKKNGIVKSVKTVVRGDDIAAVVRPLVPGPWIAVARPGVRGTDRVERWNTDNWKSAGEIQVTRDPDGNVYSLSPDGELLAFITDFPSLTVQVYSFPENRVVREIRLKTNPRDDWGEPHLLGFSRPDQLVVHWRRGNMSGLEVHSVRGAGVAARHFSVEDFDSSAGTYAISPDGQSISVLWRGADIGGIATYALGTSKLLRTFAINVLDWRIAVRPAGLAYTPDGTEIAAVIEGEAQGLFAVWPAVGKPTRPAFKQVVPLGSGAAGAANGFSGQFEGHAFDWVDDGKAYVLYGSSVFETETGRFLGDVGIENVRSQVGAGKDTVELVRSTESGHVEVDAVTLDLANARDSADASAQRPVGRPATRRAASAARDRGAAGEPSR